MSELGLPFSPFYSDPNYNNIRRSKLLIIKNILLQNNLFKDNNHKVKIEILKNIEDACYNETLYIYNIKTSKIKPYPTVWNNTLEILYNNTVNSIIEIIMNHDLFNIYKNIIKCNSLQIPILILYKDQEYNDIRRKKIILFKELLDQNENFNHLSNSYKLFIISDIEKGCLRESIRKSKNYEIFCNWNNIQFENIYHSVCFNITTCLDTNIENYSSELVNNITQNNLILDKIAELPMKSLCPHKYEPIIKKIEQRSNIKENVKYTELYFCKKCKRNKTTAERIQNRCNDEGSTYYITCLF